MRSVVVVLGASGGIGRAVTASQVANGRHVVAVARGENVLEMKDEFVTPVIADAAKPEDLEDVFALAADIGAVDAVVHSVFADARVPLTEQRPLDTLLRVQSFHRLTWRREPQRCALAAGQTIQVGAAGFEPATPRL